MLARGVTAVALTEWLEGSPKAALRALADVGLRNGVDQASTATRPAPLASVLLFLDTGCQGGLKIIS